MYVTGWSPEGLGRTRVQFADGTSYVVTNADAEDES